MAARCLAAALLVVTCLCVASAPSARAQTASPAIALPTYVDGRQTRALLSFFDAGQFGPLENHAGGPVTVDEDVRVLVAPDGTVGPVHEVQAVDVEGTGDYIVELPSGARAATPLPDSENEPGLRDGTVLWEGFSGGSEHLAADVELADPARFPLGVTARPSSGEVTLLLRNTTALEVVVPAGAPQPAALRAALEAARTALAAGAELAPGVTPGLPAELPAAGGASGAGGPAKLAAGVAVHVEGTVAFAGEVRPVDVTLPATDGAEGTLALSGPTPVVPDLELSLEPPRPEDVPTLDPDVGPGAGGEADADARAALAGLVGVIASSLVGHDYLPFVPGAVEATTTASFTIGPGIEVASSETPSSAGPGGLGASGASPASPAPTGPPPISPGLALGVLLAIVLAGAGVWSQS